jgi:predicted secreted protein
MELPIGRVTMLAIYIVCWWVVLFAVLPLGMSQQDQAPPTDGSQWGAPDKPDLKRKFITTTWASALLWLLVMILIVTGWMPLPAMG